MKTNQSTSWVHSHTHGSSRGFSLVEVLIAMGIFAVGFVAVAAMFPAGAMLQKETVAQVESQLVARNAAAIVRSARITFSADGSFNADLKDSSGDGNLQAFALATPNVSAKVKTRWKLGDRGYPTAQQSLTDRKYYWVPFLRRTSVETDSKDATKKQVALAADKADWNILIFVLRREPAQKYLVSGTTFNGVTIPGSPIWANEADGPDVPKVVGIVPTAASGSRFSFSNRLYPTTAAGFADQVRAGDFIADNNGVNYIVSDADATGCTIVGGIAPTPTGGTLRMWYAPPPAAGAPSPCTRIVQISGLVEDATP